VMSGRGLLMREMLLLIIWMLVEEVCLLRLCCLLVFVGVLVEVLEMLLNKELTVLMLVNWIGGITMMLIGGLRNLMIKFGKILVNVGAL